MGWRDVQARSHGAGYTVLKSYGFGSRDHPMNHFVHANYLPLRNPFGSVRQSPRPVPAANDSPAKGSTPSPYPHRVEVMHELFLHDHSCSYRARGNLCLDTHVLRAS